MIAGRHSTMCACGLPMRLLPDVAIQICSEHCDRAHPVLHPSVVCEQCETLRAVEATR